MSEERPRDVLVRITHTPELARAVPLLRPDVLHAVIVHCGLQDCGELVVLATGEQLSAVFDLDLWKASHGGADEQFDPARFGEWLEVLVDAGPAIAAERLAKIDVALVIAGLSAHVRAFDPGVFSPGGAPSGADPVLNAGREHGVHVEVGGFLVVPRRPDAWEAIVEVLVALDEQYPDTFQRAMRACRRLSNAGWERDGLDDLLLDAEQARFDLSVDREQRRERFGFLPPPQARALLESARQVHLPGAPPETHPLFSAYRRSFTVINGEEIDPAATSAGGKPDAEPAVPTAAVATVIEMLRGAGMLADAPRTLLAAAHNIASPVNAALERYLQIGAESDEEVWTARHEEIAFLANALVAGCSVQGRAFTRREAMEAAAATCNLGLEYWPPQWPPAAQHDLVTIFEVGWTVLHRDISMVAASELLTALNELQTGDRDRDLAVHALRRELRDQSQSGTPWRSRNQLDVLATFDLPAWAGLSALFDECPVMLANVGAAVGARPLRLDPSEFRFIAARGDVAAVHEFLRSLAELLTG